MDEIRRLEALDGSDINRAKEALAFELTKTVHGESEASAALDAAHAAFSETGKDTSAIPSVAIPSADLEKGIPVLDLFAMTDLCASKSEARRLVQQGGASINEQKVDDIKAVVGSDRIEGDELLLRAGKKRYFRVVIDE